MPKGKITDPDEIARLHAEWAKQPPLSTHMTPRRRAQAAMGRKLMVLESMSAELARTDPGLAGKPGVEGPKVDSTVTLPDLELDQPPEADPSPRKP